MPMFPNCRSLVVKLFIWLKRGQGPGAEGPLWSRSRCGGPPPVKVKVKVRRPPSQGLGPPGQGPGQGPGAPPGKVPGQGLGGPLVKVWGPPQSRSRSGWAPGQGLGGPPGQGPGQHLGAPSVKVQVKVQGAPWSRSGEGPPWSRSGGGAPLVKVQVWGAPQVKVWGPPGQGQGPGQGLGGPHPRSRSGSRSEGVPQSRSGTKIFFVQIFFCPNFFCPIFFSKIFFFQFFSPGYDQVGSAGGTPLAVTQEDCLVCWIVLNVNFARYGRKS